MHRLQDILQRTTALSQQNLMMQTAGFGPFFYDYDSNSMNNEAYSVRFSKTIQASQFNLKNLVSLKYRK